MTNAGCQKPTCERITVAVFASSRLGAGVPDLTEERVGFRPERRGSAL
jgi:hypothetical protein